MEHFGYLRDKLDIKILILYILRRLPDTVEPETLTDLLTRDGAVGYFDYIECLAELESTGHVEQKSEGFRITDKGERNGGIIESSLPYTVRSRMDTAVAPLAAAMRRNSMIKASHRQTSGGWITELSLEDGLGEMLRIRLLVSDAAMAERIEHNFRRDPEGVYGRVIAMLTEDGHN